MNHFPEVFAKGIPGSKSKAYSPQLLGLEPRLSDASDQNKSASKPSVKIKLASNSTEQKEIQTSPTSSFEKGPFQKLADEQKSPQNRSNVSPRSPVLRQEARHLRGAAVIRIPSPPPLGLFSRASQYPDLAVDLVHDGKRYGKIGSAHGHRASLPGKSVVLRNAKAPSESFENQEIRGKVIKADKYKRNTNISGSQKRRKQRAITLLESVAMRPKGEVPMINVKPVITTGLTQYQRSRNSLSAAHIAETSSNTERDRSNIRDREEGRRKLSFGRYATGVAQIPPQLALPNAYLQAFGHPVTDNEKRHELVRLISELLHCSLSAVSCFRMSHHTVSQDFYILTLGDAAPISECCKSPLLIQLCKDTGGKIMCTAWQCYIRNLFNFLLDRKERESLWKWTDKDEPEAKSKAISMQIQTGGYRSRSLRSEMRRRGKRKGSLRQEGRQSPDPYVSLRRDLVFTNEKLKHIRVQSQDPHPFDMKASVTFQVPEPGRHIAPSPIRRVLAKSGKHPGLTNSLAELQSVLSAGM